jgi:hypothetical protein
MLVVAVAAATACAATAGINAVKFSWNCRGNTQQRAAQHSGKIKPYISGMCIVGLFAVRAAHQHYFTAMCAPAAAMCEARQTHLRLHRQSVHRLIMATLKDT